MKWVEHAASWAGPQIRPPHRLRRRQIPAPVRRRRRQTPQACPTPPPSPASPSTPKASASPPRTITAPPSGFTASTSETPRLLEWKGSHTGIAMHPNGDALVTLDAGKRPARLDAARRQAHAHVRLSRPKTESFGLHPLRPLARHRRRRRHRIMALLRRRPDGQAADGTRRPRRRLRQAHRLPPRARGGCRRLRQRPPAVIADVAKEKNPSHLRPRRRGAVTALGLEFFRLPPGAGHRPGLLRHRGFFQILTRPPRHAALLRPSSRSTSIRHRGTSIRHCERSEATQTPSPRPISKQDVLF